MITQESDASFCEHKVTGQCGISGTIANEPRIGPYRSQSLFLEFGDVCVPVLIVDKKDTGKPSDSR